MVGPFVQYEPPGVYTRTLTDNTLVSLTGGIRVPVLIGVGSESLDLVDYEIVRGSSSTTDNIKTEEDVSSQFNGLNREFQTALFPIVTGNGQGVPTFDPKDVKVSINGQPAGIAQVDGPKGKIILSSIPLETDKVTVTYYFKRTDTRIGGSVDFPDADNLSAQVDGFNKEFKVHYVPIVDGSNGGVATTDPFKVEVTILRGNQILNAQVSSVNGQAGTITLLNAPQPGDQVLASYWTSKWQDTFDYLPVSNITEVVRAGTGPGRNDFVNTLDFVIQENKIHWGHAFDVSAGFTSAVPGSVSFKDQVNAMLYDNRVYMRLASGVADGQNKDFTLEFVPTEGSGRGVATNNPNLVHVYIGTSVSDALNKGRVEVSSVEGSQRKIKLKNAPLAGHKVYATFWYNLLTDDTYTLTSLESSTPTRAGTYSIVSENKGGINILNIVEDKPSHYVKNPRFGTEGITFASEGFDGVLIPGFAKEETILLNFINNKDYYVLSSIGGEGSNGTGTLGQTYIDARTGTRFTIMKPPGDEDSFADLVLENPEEVAQGEDPIYWDRNKLFNVGDILEFDITKEFKTGPQNHLSIAGMKVAVNDLSGVTPANTALFSTFNKSGNEPKVGDFYFVTAKYAKTDFPIKIYNKIRDVVSDIGDINTSNRLSLAASLAFSNGAIAVALAQVLRDAQGIDASPQAYLEVLRTLESPIPNTNIKPSIVCALTTKRDIINEIRLHCEKMSTIRNKSERTAVFGFPVGTTPEQAQQFARAQKSERLVGVYPDGAIIGLLDQFGNVSEAVVDGSFLAAAYAGLAVNPTFDVATPLTHKTLTGFRRLVRSLDAVTMNQTAIAGVTILEDLAPNLLIRQAMTTNPQNVLTREPTVVYIKDYVQEQVRNTLDPFIGIKFLPTVIQDVESSIDNLLNKLVNLQIITAFQGTSAIADEFDPSILRVETFYSPVLPLNWIVVNLNLRVRL